MHVAEASGHVSYTFNTLYRQSATGSHNNQLLLLAISTPCWICSASHVSGTCLYGSIVHIVICQISPTLWHMLCCRCWSTAHSRTQEALYCSVHNMTTYWGQAWSFWPGYVWTCDTEYPRNVIRWCHWRPIWVSLPLKSDHNSPATSMVAMLT